MASTPESSAVHLQRFSVVFEYPVVFTQDVLDPGNGTLAWAMSRTGPEGPTRCLFVVDAGLARCWPDLTARIEAYADAHSEFALAGPVGLVPGGEAAKADMSVVDTVLSRIAEAHLDRHAFVVAIGGGAMLDAVGYAAALAHRGVRLIRIPSTVLAQNDAGVGVKNGINAFGNKNFLGTFATPHAVLNDIGWISTLPERDRIAGVAEAVKVGLIRDADFFEWLEANAAALRAGARDETATMIRRCAELHLRHIAEGGDPFERGSARPLDYGHWAAHKLELLSGHELRHGEAVSIGMLLDAQYAAATGDLSQAVLHRLDAVLGALGLPRWHGALDQREPDGTRAVLRGLEEFREHLGGRLTITLVQELGHGIEVNAIDWARMNAALDSLRQRHGPP